MIHKIEKYSIKNYQNVTSENYTEELTDKKKMEGMQNNYDIK